MTVTIPPIIVVLASLAYVALVAGVLLTVLDRAIPATPPQTRSEAEAPGSGSEIAPRS